MAMLAAVPRRWFSWDFSLERPTGDPVGDVRLSSWRERGSVLVAGVRYSVRRDGFLGPFVLEAPDGRRMASAIKPRALRRQFEVTDGRRRYILKARSRFGREYGLFDGDDQRLGHIRACSWLGRRARVELDERVPPLVQAFVVWLTLLLWKRDAQSAAGFS